MDVHKVSIVAPVFNEEASLAEFFRRVTLVIEDSRFEWEVVLVDDGSTDSSFKLCNQQSESDPRFRTIGLSRNFGHQSAILAGITEASGDAVVTMDSDLQDPPEIIPRLTDAWQDGADVVHAQRATRSGESVFKKTTAALFYRLIDWMSDTNLPKNVGDFRLMNRRVVDEVLSLREKSLYLRGMVAWVGFRQVFVEFNRDARFAGTTKYPLSKMLNLALDAMLSFSDRPLRLLTRLGLAVTSLSFVLIMFFTLSMLVSSTAAEPGWLSIILVSLFLGGIQLVCLGVLGEYISRIYRESKNRPLFIVASRTHDR